MFIRVHTGAITGIEAVEVTAEVNVGTGGIGLFIVGLPDNTIKESHERIQAAFENSGFKLQAKKTVVNLAPADLRKEGSQYDLPIAIGILIGEGDIGKDEFTAHLFRERRTLVDLVGKGHNFVKSRKTAHTLLQLLEQRNKTLNGV